MALHSLLQAIQLDYASGYLRLEGGGVLHILDGEIVAASTARAEGDEAVMLLLSRRRGDFTFERGAPPASAPLAPLMNLLLESARLEDEWRRVAKHVIRIVDSSRIPDDDPCLASFVEWIDGRRTIEELAHLGAGSSTEILASVRAGISTGALARARKAETGAARSEPEQQRSFGDLLASARAELRGGDLESAARLLHRALDRRPEDRIAKQNLRRVATLISSRRRAT